MFISFVSAQSAYFLIYTPQDRRKSTQLSLRDDECQFPQGQSTTLTLQILKCILKPKPETIFHTT